MDVQTLLVQEMARIVAANPERLATLQKDTVLELEKLGNDAAKQLPAYTTDILLYCIAIVVLGALALLAAIGAILLTVNGKTTPEVLVALGSSAVGALVGLFAPSPTSK